ncbi:MAG: hypothetical protein AAFN77_05605 [Planctomycetota bacterium]
MAKPANNLNLSEQTNVDVCTGDVAESSRKVSLTLFTVPKPFGVNEHIDRIQRNAIRSWLAISSDVSVLMLGDERGVADAAAELGATHIGGLAYNEQGTPLVSSAFELARQHANSELLMYCNADVILLKDLMSSIEMIRRDDSIDSFVAFGRRTDIDLRESLRFDQLRDIERLMRLASNQGRIASQVCKEYFVFSRKLFQQMPPFAIGRGNWDNWIIHHAKSMNIPVINISDLVTVLHQNHDYIHTGAGRMKCYVSGDEAKRNQELGGGRHLISGSVGTLRLTKNGIRPERPLLINPAFWADVPRFVRLMSNLLFSR